MLISALAVPCALANGERPEIVYSHGFSYVVPMKYPPDFTHFEYVNPNAPKVGLIRANNRGVWDSFNDILDKGRAVLPYRRVDYRVLVYDRLLEQANDEFESYYGRLAEGIWIADDYRQFAFKLRDNAYWHDGKPVTAEDVIFTFLTMKEVGGAGVRSELYELDTVEKIGEHEVLFSVKPNTPGHLDLVAVVGRFSVLPKHYWETRDITKTTIEPPLGSGPYRIESYDLGRNIVMKLDPNYWGKDLPVNKGRYNFDRVRYDYFRDQTVMFEAFRGGTVDVHVEIEAKNWMTSYNFPAVTDGYVKRNLFELSRGGLWDPVLWNLTRSKFQDIRVREALWFLSDFRYTNRVLEFGFFDYATSYFHKTPMASSGLPSAKELELLEPWRGQIPDRIFTEEWLGNETSGYGVDRDNVRRSLELFKAAGWEIVDGVMTNVDTGEPFTIDFVFNSPYPPRQQSRFVGMLNMVGIETTGGAVEYSNWLYRLRNAVFDATTLNFRAPNMPGGWLRNWLGSAAARSNGSMNFGRVQNPAIDAMIEHVLAARTPEDFFAAIHALDRILLWNYYRIPGSGYPAHRLAHSDKFGSPGYDKPFRWAPWLDTWWWDQEKAEHVRRGIAEL